MAHVRWTARPALREPVVIAAFEGWNDAGDAATTAARYLVDRWDIGLVGEVDPEEFYDFTSTRPQVQLDDDGIREIIWPATEIFSGTIPGGDDDVMIIIGPSASGKVTSVSSSGLHGSWMSTSTSK